MKKPRFLKKFLNLFLFSLLICSLLNAQASDSSYALSSLAEKIYLQADSKVYTTDNTIWLKVIVTNASDHSPSALSKVLYVELIDANGKVVQNKLLKIEEGVSEGFFQLDDTYAEGVYLIRGYTEWVKNFGTDFFAQDYIKIFPSAKAKADKQSPVSNIVLEQTIGGQRRLSATFAPLKIDSLHSKDLTLILSFDSYSDTMALKKDGANNYQLNYVVPDSSLFATMKMVTKNNRHHIKTILLQEQYLGLAFFAESGTMVHGMPAVLGYKALDGSKKGKQVEGRIVNGKGEEVARFKSNSLGMGKILLAAVDSSEKYTARVFDSQGYTGSFELPAVAAYGNILSVSKENGKLRITVRSNYMGGDSVTVQVMCRGMVYFSVKGFLKNGVLNFSLPVNALPEGIIAFTLQNEEGQPVAERLYFNERPDTRLNIDIATDSQSYLQREQTTLNIETKNAAGQSVPARVSVVVLNNDQTEAVQGLRKNILSYFLLGSDLRNEVENPGYYFSDTAYRSDDIDALLLTQGWRRYNYSQPLTELPYRPETSLVISGKLGGVLLQNTPKKNIGLTLMTFGATPYFDSQVSDSAGRFSFVMDNQEGDQLNVLIQTMNKTGTQKDYAISLDKRRSPPVTFDPIQSVEKPDSFVQAYVAKNMERKRAADEYRIRTEGATLDDVTVTSYRMTPERKLVSEKYGKPKWVIEGEAIQKKEEKWSYGLYSVLLFNFPDKVHIERRDGDLYALVRNSDTTLVVIDGIPVRDVDYPLIPYIPPSEVSSVEIIENASNFQNLFCEVYPMVCGQCRLCVPPFGDVIAIYTHGRQGLFGAYRRPGLVKAVVPVFAARRTFDAPKYTQLKPEDWQQPDLRSLIHWEPKAKTDNTGKYSTTFCNADITGKMKVVVEAITAVGELGYQEIFFEVKKQKQE